MQNVALRLHHAHETHQVAGVVQGHGEVVAAGIELETTAEHDVAQHGEAAFAGDVQIRGQDAVGNDGEGLVGVTAFAEHDLLDAELLGGFGVLDGHAGGLHVVVEHAVVHGVVTGDFGAQGPGKTGGFEDQGEGRDVVGPGEHFTGIVDEQNVGVRHVPGGLEFVFRGFDVVFVDEFHGFLHHVGIHAGGGTDLELELGALFMQFAGVPAEFLAEELAQFAGDEAVVHTDGAHLGAAAAQVAAVGEFGKTHHGLPVEFGVAVTPLGEGFLLHILLVDAAEQFGAEVRTIHFMLVGHFVQMAGFRAGVALRAVVHGGVEHGEAGPVVLGREQLAHAVEETIDQLFLFGLGLGHGDEQHVDIVEQAAVLLLLRVGNDFPGEGLIVHGHGTKGVHINRGELPFFPRQIIKGKFLRSFHVGLLSPASRGWKWQPLPRSSCRHPEHAGHAS